VGVKYWDVVHGALEENYWEQTLYFVFVLMIEVEEVFFCFNGTWADMWVVSGNIYWDLRFVRLQPSASFIQKMVTALYVDMLECIKHTWQNPEDHKYTLDTDCGYLSVWLNCNFLKTEYLQKCFEWRGKK
jgi:hypothetical protein